MPQVSRFTKGIDKQWGIMISYFVYTFSGGDLTDCKSYTILAKLFLYPLPTAWTTLGPKIHIYILIGSVVVEDIESYKIDRNHWIDYAQRI